MLRYSLHYIDKASRLIDDQRLRAPDLWHAMACANRRLHRSFLGAREPALDPKGRVDVLDPSGVLVARIYCAEAISAMS
jgi:hypothetical protein